MCGGGGGSQPSTTTQVVEPFGAQKNALRNTFGLSKKAFGAGPQEFFPGSTVGGISDATLGGQEAALGAVGTLGGLGAQGANSASMLLDPNSMANAASMAALDPNSAQSQALIAPMIANLQSQILPSIGSNAIQQGAFGGDRQFLQQQQAADSTMGAAADAILRNQMGAQQAMNSNMGLGLSAMPGVTQQMLEPSRVMSAVGGQQDARQQQLTDAAVNRFQFNQNAPEVALDRLISRISGVNLGTIGNTTQGGGGGGNNLGALLGAGLTGHALFSGGGK